MLSMVMMQKWVPDLWIGLFRKKLRNPLQEVLFGSLSQRGGTVFVTVKDDALSIEVEAMELTEA